MQRGASKARCSSVVCRFPTVEISKVSCRLQSSRFVDHTPSAPYSGPIPCLLRISAVPIASRGVVPLLILFPPRLVLTFETKSAWLGSKAGFPFYIWMWKQNLLPAFQTKADPDTADDSYSSGKNRAEFPSCFSLHWICVAITRKSHQDTSMMTGCAKDLS